MKAKGGLGKGLEALIPQMTEDEGNVLTQTVRVSELSPNPYQPRREFDPDKLRELVDSIREHGVLQPIVVRKRAVGFGYEIIAGERRFRAAQQIGLHEIPAVVRNFSDRDAMEIALIENLQREDLNSIEIAEAYVRIMEHFSLTQEEMAVRVGQSRSHVANLIRLLSLPTSLQESVSRGTISMGHARALLGIDQADLQIKLAQRIESEGLSVRDVEQIVQENRNVPRETNKIERKKEEKEERSSTLQEYESLFRDCLGTAVRIQQGKRKGKIEIEYYTIDDLERILAIVHTEQN